jgi:adenylate cyclase
MAGPLLRETDIRSSYPLTSFRTQLPYAAAIIIFGVLSGALIATAGAATGLAAPWWMLLVAPTGNLACGLVAAIALRWFGNAAMYRFPNLPPAVVLSTLSGVAVLAAFFPIWFLLSPFLIGPVLWDWTGTWVPAIALGTTVAVLAVFSVYARLNAHLLASFAELERRRGLERFLASETVERVLAGDTLALAGERRVVTVLFADLRGSTRLADTMLPADVVEHLNRYVGAMAESVFAHGGMLDKFLGDGLMAIFGVMDEPTAGAMPAVRAALTIRQRLALLNEGRTEPVRFGIGIHTGEVVLGAVGISRRTDFTAVGDTVNTASRLEGLCKRFGVDCILSDTTASRLNESVALRSLGPAAVRGKARPMPLLTLA